MAQCWRYSDCPNDECGKLIAIVVDDENPVTHRCGWCWASFILVKKKPGEENQGPAEPEES